MTNDWRQAITDAQPRALTRALTYPVRGRARERPLVAAWVLVLAGTIVPSVPAVPALGLLVPGLAAVALAGYLVRVLVASENGDPAPALLADPVDLVRRGVGALFVSAVVLALPVVSLVVTVYGAMNSAPVPDPTTADVLRIYAGSTTVLILSLLGAYILPIVLCRYGETGSIYAGLARSGVRAIGTHAGYFAGWTAACGGFAVAASVASWIVATHPGGPLVATALLAYASIIAVHVWGRSLARAR